VEHHDCLDFFLKFSAEPIAQGIITGTLAKTLSLYPLEIKD
jgi:hypothetical protein